ncbi:Uncharacterised protein [Mycobacteroides abscessus subsp. abscessus]|nr:Uncharacterised protein [Mycobacteroides abscessus subsp. abscessus]
MPSPFSLMNTTSRRSSLLDSWNASVIFLAVTLDGASAGKIASGCFSAISVREGKVKGNAMANATQAPITTHGHRTTRSASRRINSSPSL